MAYRGAGVEMIFGLPATDVHQHVIPPRYRESLAAHGIDNAGGRPLPHWSPQDALAMMDQVGIARATVSISSPGVWFGDDVEAREIAAFTNDFMADLARTHSGRFGFFASLPLPDVDAALAELARADGDLGCSGVLLLTNVGGRYLGDPDFEELYTELSRRNMPVLIHPTIPTAKPILPISDYTLEFVFDTTRALVNLAYGGVLARHPGIRLIGSHAGGTLPFLSARIERGWRSRPDALAAAPGGVMDDLRRIRFDTAISAEAESLDAVMGFAGPGSTLFGSDYPFMAVDAVVDHARRLQNYLDHAGDDVARAVLCANAAATLTRIETT